MNWTVSDFVFAGALIFGALGAYAFAAKRTRNRAYRAGVGIALGAAVVLLWANGAVGLTDSAADAAYVVVPAVGILGAVLARFQPGGMARAMFATALVQALIGLSALAAGMVPAHNSTLEILGITGVFIALFTGAGVLFREAARGT